MNVNKPISRRKALKVMGLGMLAACANQEQNKKEENMTTLNLTQEWDKLADLFKENLK